MSIESVNNDGAAQSAIYQGLSQSQWQGKAVMIKWQLLAQDLPQTDLLETETLATEIAILKQIIAQHTQTPLSSKHPALFDLPKFTSKLSNQHNWYADYCVTPLLINARQTIEFNQQVWQFTFFAMPYFKQGSLKAYLSSKTETLTHPQKLQLLSSLAKTIATLHQLGWVHGDIKSSNVLVQFVAKNHQDTLQFNTWLIDVSYAMRIDAKIDEKQYGSQSTASHKSTNCTSLANPRGTPAYLAPECWHASPISVQSDIYAFGVLAYEVLTAQKPYQVSHNQTNRLTEWAVAHCQLPIPLLFTTVSYKDVDKQSWQVLQSIINRLLAKKAANRYQFMEEVVFALQQEVEQP